MEATVCTDFRSLCAKACRVLPAALIILPLAAYAALLLYIPPDPLQTSDAKSYWFTAGELLEKHEFRERFDTGTTPSTWRPPLTAIFLAISRLTGLEASEILWINWVMVAVTAAVIIAAARELTSSKWTPYLAGFIYLAHPQTYLASRVLMSETPYMLVLSVCLLTALRSTRTAQRMSRVPYLLLLAVGLFYGLSLLARTVSLALLPGLVVLLIARSRAAIHRTLHIRAVASRAAIFVAGTALVIVPWQIRNHHIHDSFVFISTAGSYNLYIGVVHNTSGLRDAEAAAYATEAPYLNEIGIDTIVLGPGHIQQAHQPDEYLALEQINPMVDILKGLIREFCL